MKKNQLLTIMTLLFVIAFSTLQPNSALAKEYHWGFSKSKEGIPAEAGAEFDSILNNYGSFYKGNLDEKVIYLTFDNGFEAGYTKGILDTLRKENVPATFFLVSHYLTSAPELVQQMIQDGHIIGNHSHKHPNMAQLTEEQMIDEWKKFDDLLNEKTGIKRTYYARPPKGIFNEKLLDVGNKQGYTHIFWSIAFKDWDTDGIKDKSYAYNELIKQLHPGAIILMHTVAKHNAEALPDFIIEAKKQGYSFGTLDDLMMSKHMPKLESE